MDPASRPYSDAPRLPAGQVEVAVLLDGRPPRLELEIGPGRGGFMLERLAAEPRIGLIGLEIRRKWAQIVDERLRAHGFGPRGRVFAEDAREAMTRMGPAGALSAVFLNFPDPWWKKKHHKRLVLGSGVLDEAARLLAPGGDLFVQTDVEERALAYEAQILAHPCFTPNGDPASGASLAANPYSATSHRERRAVADAIPIYRLRFSRRA